MINLEKNLRLLMEYRNLQIEENIYIDKRINELEKYVEKIKHISKKVDELYDKFDPIDDDEDDVIWEIKIRDGKLKFVEISSL